MEGKAYFLGDLHPYHLYGWELFEKPDMMDGAMNYEGFIKLWLEYREIKLAQDD